MLKRIILCCVALSFLAYLTTKNANAFTLQSYRLTESTKGENWQQLQHDIFRLVIDFPRNWAFGIVRMQGTEVILLYPADFNSPTITNEYMSVEISRMDFYMPYDTDLNQILTYTMSGYLDLHKNSKVLDIDTKNHHLIMTWRSKNNVQVIEDILMRRSGKLIYGLTIRASEPAFRANAKLLNEIRSSFKPQDLQED